MKDVFCRIIAGELPCNKVYEDDEVIAILDASQTTRGHTLVMPKAHCTSILDCPSETMHKVYDQIQAAVSVPVLHIADVTLEALRAQGLRRVALLGTRYTMEQDFYKRRLAEGGLEVLIPEAADRREINRVIFEELCRGVISPHSKAYFLRVLEDMKSAGAEGAILGCTEIGLLVGQEDTDLPLFDTTLLHAQAAAERSLLA